MFSSRGIGLPVVRVEGIIGGGDTGWGLSRQRWWERIRML